MPHGPDGRSALGGMQPHIAAVRARHEGELLRYPNVVGVASGVHGRTGEPCLVVYVTRKLPPDQLGADELLPAEVEGVPVDVVETGRITAPPSA